MYLAAPCHPIPHRLLRPARLVQKREQVKGSARRASRGKRGAAEVDFPPVSSHGVTRDRAFLESKSFIHVTDRIQKTVHFTN